jgi:transposase InsO family protein
MHRIGLHESLSTLGSPWQNGYAERLIGTTRRECLDHVIVLNEFHLRSILKSYLGY